MQSIEVIEVEPGENYVSIKKGGKIVGFQGVLNAGGFCTLKIYVNVNPLEKKTEPRDFLIADSCTPVGDEYTYLGTTQFLIDDAMLTWIAFRKGNRDTSIGQTKDVHLFEILYKTS